MTLISDFAWCTAKFNRRPEPALPAKKPHLVDVDTTVAAIGHALWACANESLLDETAADSHGEPTTSARRERANWAAAYAWLYLADVPDSATPATVRRLCVHHVASEDIAAVVLCRHPVTHKQLGYGYIGVGGTKSAVTLERCKKQLRKSGYCAVELPFEPFSTGTASSKARLLVQGGPPDMSAAEFAEVCARPSQWVWDCVLGRTPAGEPLTFGVAQYDKPSHAVDALRSKWATSDVMRRGCVMTASLITPNPAPSLERVQGTVVPQADPGVCDRDDTDLTVALCKQVMCLTHPRLANQVTSMVSQTVPTESDLGELLQHPEQLVFLVRRAEHSLKLLRDSNFTDSPCTPRGQPVITSSLDTTMHASPEYTLPALGVYTQSALDFISSELLRAENGLPPLE